MRLIDADAAKKTIMDEVIAPDWFKTVANMAISNLPTVDPVKHAHKVKHYLRGDTTHALLLKITCSNCAMAIERPSYKFCQDCGAMLDLSDMFETDIDSLCIG